MYLMFIRLIDMFQVIKYDSLHLIITWYLKFGLIATYLFDSILART